MDTAQLWVRYKRQGDDAARDALIREYGFLVPRMAEHLGLTAPQNTAGDLSPYGTHGLAEAVEKYRPGLDPDFEAYASARIGWAMLEAVIGGRHPLSRHGATRVSPAARAMVAPPAQRRRETHVLAEEREILIRAIGSLPPEERLLLALYYFEELTHAEIGQVVHMAEAAVRLTCGRALMRLRAHLRSHADIYAAA